VTERTSIA